MSIPKPFDVVNVASELDSVIYAYHSELTKIGILEQHGRLSGEEVVNEKEKAAKVATKKLLRFVLNSYILSLND